MGSGAVLRFRTVRRPCPGLSVCSEFHLNPNTFSLQTCYVVCCFPDQSNQKDKYLILFMLSFTDPESVLLSRTSESLSVLNVLSALAFKMGVTQHFIWEERLLAMRDQRVTTVPPDYDIFLFCCSQFPLVILHPDFSFGSERSTSDCVSSRTAAAL